jgi:hypothetical protein
MFSTEGGWVTTADRCRAGSNPCPCALAVSGGVLFVAVVLHHEILSSWSLQ